MNIGTPTRLALQVATRLVLLALAASPGTWTAWAQGAAAPYRNTGEFPGEPIRPLPPAAAQAPAKVQLGERLFHDPSLSGDGTVACVSCHRLDRGGDDNRARSIGAHGQKLPVNTPTVFNAALNFRLNWRGNFRTFEEQAEAVLLDPGIMNISWDELLSRLAADPDYRAAFARAYGGGPDRTQVLDALAAFQKTLLTPDAPFDRHLRGERGAIPPEAERGYTLFKEYGCAACHQGVNVGGNLFQKFGIFDDPFADRTDISEADLGRLLFTGDPRDLHVFRVPSLRNVGVTAPYFHDGSAPSLDTAVAAMAKSQLGLTLPEKDISLIVSFLRTLTGEFRGERLSAQDPAQ